MWILPQSKQKGSSVGPPVVSGDLSLPILPPSCTSESHADRILPAQVFHVSHRAATQAFRLGAAVIFAPLRPFLCVSGWAGVGGLSHILNPPFLCESPSEFGQNCRPRWQWLPPKVCECLWLLICFLFTMSAAPLAFVLIMKTQFIIKTRIVLWNWVLKVL